MRDLGDLMWAAADERAGQLADLTPSPAELSTLRTRVRRGRVVRHVREAAVALPVVAAVVAAGWFGIDQLLAEPAPPVTTPEPTVPTPDPTPAPTPTPEESEEIVLGDPIDEPGLPTYYAMPDGLLDHVDPGWVLATYAPRAELAAFGAENSAPPVELVFVISPDGTRHLVSRFDPGVTADASGVTWVEHELVAWEADSTRATVREVRHSVDSRNVERVEVVAAQRLDLATGALTSMDGDVEPAPEGLSPDASMLMRLEQPDGTTVVERVSDGAQVAALPLSGPAGWCRPVAWWSADTVLAACLDEDPFAADGDGIVITRHPRLVTFTLDEVGSGAGTILRRIGSGEPFPFGDAGTHVADGVVAWVGDDRTDRVSQCASGVYLQTGDRIERLAADGDGRAWVNAWVVQAVDGVVYVQAAGACATDEHPTILTAYDVATGTTTELMPAPPGENPNDLWSQGLSSYVVAE